MNVELSLFGAFREYDSAALIHLDVPDGACVKDLRAALVDYGAQHWPDFKPGLLARSAFASESAVLRDAEAIPADGKMAVLPPVSGG